MTYQEAIAYIDSIPKFTKKTSLEHTRVLLKELGNPEEDVKIFHVAGTNGKGSVCAFLEAMLLEGGKTVGLFTSPHLVKTNERFRINGIDVDDEAFLCAFEQVMDASRACMEKGLEHPTYFETLFLMGMLLYKEANVEYVILETGMGGRLDATNAMQQAHFLASVITSVSLDHTEYLGNTIREIAGEKAGIIKDSCPVIFDATNTEVTEVMEQTAKDKGVDSVAVINSEKMDIPFDAEYQQQNAAIALQAMMETESVHGIPKNICLEGLKKAKWSCRMEEVLPKVYIDGAHNEDGIRQFVKAASRIREGQRAVLLFGAVEEKRYVEMVSVLQSGLQADAMVVTEIGSYRGASPEQLAEECVKAGCKEVIIEHDPGCAFEKALQEKGDGFLFCVGSLYLAGKLREHLETRE